MNKVTYPKLHKHNQNKPIKGRCSHCLEKVIFRVVKIDKVNHLACTMCLKSRRLYKTTNISSNPMIMTTPLTFEDRVRRMFFRIETYFSGNHVYLPFKIRRKSPLGVKITKLLIRIKGM